MLETWPRGERGSPLRLPPVQENDSPLPFFFALNHGVMNNLRTANVTPLSGVTQCHIMSRCVTNVLIRIWRSRPFFLISFKPICFFVQILALQMNRQDVAVMLHFQH